MDNRLIVGHALEGVVKGVEAILAEGGRTTLDLKTVHGTSEVPSSLGLSRVDSSSAVIPALRPLCSLALLARQCLGTTSIIPQSLL